MPVRARSEHVVQSARARMFCVVPLSSRPAVGMFSNMYVTNNVRHVQLHVITCENTLVPIMRAFFTNYTYSLLLMGPMLCYLIVFISKHGMVRFYVINFVCVTYFQLQFCIFEDA